jgi:hypothetical protein
VTGDTCVTGETCVTGVTYILVSLTPWQPWFRKFHRFHRSHGHTDLGKVCRLGADFPLQVI